MNRLAKIAMLLSIPLLVFAGLQLDRLWRCYAVGSPADVVNEIGKPYAVLTIEYGEPVKGFIEGEFYVLKVLKIRDTKIDYGFCPIKREAFYAKED